MAFKSRICSRRKQAVDWTGPLDKTHYREDASNADRLAREINAAVVKLMKNIKVKGSNLYEWAHQLGKGLQGVATTTDTEIKRGYYQLRSQLQGLLEDTDQTILNQFYSRYGHNPQDWRFIKISSHTSQKGTAMFKSRMAKRHTASVVPVDVEIGGMRRHFESDLSGDERNAETDHKDDKFQKNYPTKQEKYDTPRDQQNKLELPKKASKSKKGSDSDYTLETWFERDRKHVELLHKGETVCDWWDDAVDEMVEDGFLNPKDWLGSAIEYAKAHGLIKSASFKSRLAARHKMADEGMPVNEEPETSEEIPSEKPAPVEEAPKVEETPAEPTGDVNDWVQKVMDYKSEQEHDELVDALLEACDAVGVPEEQTDAVVEKVMQDSGLEVDDLAVEETGLETTEPIQSPEPVAEESEEEPTERNEEIDHEACDKTADAEPEVHEAKGPLTEENQLVKVKNLMEQASKILGENKDALLNSNNPGADAHMDAVDGILETLAHSPISEMSSNSTVEQIKSVMGILMELQGEFPGELKGIGEAVRLCNEAYKALTSFRSSFGMTSADKTADEMPEVEGDGGEQDRFKSRASELLAAHDQELPEDVTDWLMQIAENGIDGVSKEATVDLCKRYDGVNEMLPEDIFDFTVDVADALEISDEDLDFPEDLDNDPESDIQGTLPENDIVGEEDRSFNQNMTPNTGM
jgi:hypothetical protein